MDSRPSEASLVRNGEARNAPMIVQLDPPIPIYHSERGEGYAILVVDYSQEHDMLWTVIFDSGEIWTLPIKELRGCLNVSMGRFNAVKKTQGGL